MGLLWPHFLLFFFSFTHLQPCQPPYQFLIMPHVLSPQVPALAWNFLFSDIHMPHFLPSDPCSQDTWMVTSFLTNHDKLVIPTPDLYQHSFSPCPARLFSISVWPYNLPAKETFMQLKGGTIRDCYSDTQTRALPSKRGICFTVPIVTNIRFTHLLVRCLTFSSGTQPPRS